MSQASQPDWDQDLESFSREQLVAEVRKLRAGIRQHRDCSGHDLCWYHPHLWALLPEQVEPTPTVPDWPQFMRGCVHYRASLDAQCPQAPRSQQEFQASGCQPGAPQTDIDMDGCIKAAEPPSQGDHIMSTFAFVFPGQGSQSPGMLDAWGDRPVVRETLQEASDALGQDVGQLIREGSKEELALTTNTQPVMLVAGIAAWRMWLAEGGAAPAVLAGHSLGEYSALVAAGALTLAQAAPLVRFRAAAMQEAVPVGTGAMAAILGLDATTVRSVCEQCSRETGEVAEAVNFNDPTQTVIAGSKAGVEQACAALKAAGAKRALPLPVSAPFHSSLMKPAADKLQQKLAETAFAAPRLPVVNNIDVAVQTEPEAIKEALYRQAFGPVRWVECVQAIAARGATHIVECGPGKVLSGMSKRIDDRLQTLAIYDPETLAAAKAALA